MIPILNCDGPPEGGSPLGMDTFAAFVSFLLVYRIFGFLMPTNDTDGSEPWLFVWRWRAGASGAHPHDSTPHLDADSLLRYWEVNRRGLAVAGRCSACLPLSAWC
ncbi:MAG: hypothetical protein ACLT8E_03660 [Akkermansia sp.]